MIEFRKAETTELYKVRRVAYATWPDTFVTMIPAEQLNYMLDQIYDEEALRQQVELGHIFMLAVWGGETVGFASYQLNYEAKPRLMIHKLYLLPGVQDLGIGARFIQLLTDIARMNNNTALRLKVFYLNLKAIGFYRKQGFSIAGTETTRFGKYDPVIDYVMVKDI